MMEEILKIFDENRKEIGTTSRSEVHSKGYWHETFHCWFISKENELDYIYLQLRSKEKKDFPNLLDITAAGHILADEEIIDGIREVKEELGIAVSIEQLIPLGIVKNCIITSDIIDKEWSHVYLYKMPEQIELFKLQKEEVAGMVKATLNDFIDLCLDKQDSILIKGFTIDNEDIAHTIEKYVSKKDLVPHQYSYLEEVANLIKQHTFDLVDREYTG